MRNFLHCTTMLKIEKKIKLKIISKRLNKNFKNYPINDV